MYMECLPIDLPRKQINQMWVNTSYTHRVGYRCYSSPNHKLLRSSKRHRAAKAAQVPQVFR